MANLNSNILLAIFVAIFLVALIYWLNKNNDQPIHNQGTINRNGTVGPYNNVNSGMNTNVRTNANVNRNVNGINLNRISNNAALNNNNNNLNNISGNNVVSRPANPPILDNRKPDDISGSIVDQLVAQYSVEDRPINGGSGSFTASDPMASEYGSFSGYGTKRQLNMKQMEYPYSDNEYDPRDFSYKKKKFTKRTPDDVTDLFNVNKMLPQEVEEDWFDVEPLLTTKKIRGTHLIHPKVHMGVNTVQNSLRNATHDIRGDIPNPKINVSPWMNSTIEPDTNLKGICNPI